MIIGITDPIGIITPIKIIRTIPVIFYFLNKNLNFLLCNIK